MYIYHLYVNLLELCLIRKNNNQKLKQPCFVYHVYIDVGNQKVLSLKKKLAGVARLFWKIENAIKSPSYRNAM